MENTYQLAAGLSGFVTYFALSVLFLIIFKVVYTLVTPHKEWTLIKQGNTAAAVGFGGAMIGFALAMASAAKNSVSIPDFAIWACVALTAQLVAFFIVRLLFMPKIASRLEQGEVSAGVIVAATSVAVGLINAACMTY